MSWNHRVLRHAAEGHSEAYLAIHEVYYDEADKPNGVTSDPIAPIGETLDELRAELARMLAATGQPILDYADFVKMEKK